MKGDRADESPVVNISASWLVSVSQDRKRKNMTTDQIQKWNVLWENRWRELRAYIEENDGDSRVPRTDESRYKQLGEWVKVR